MLSNVVVRGPRERKAIDFQIVGLCLVVAGAFAAYPFDYLCVVIPALAPLLFWIRFGTPGIPTLPIVSGLFIIYYGIPLFRGDLPTDDAGEIFNAASAVAGFLVSATLVYLPLLRLARRRYERTVKPAVADGLIVELGFAGVASGIVFYIALFTGLLEGLGEFLGVVRAVGVTFASVGCYLLGAARANRQLRGFVWATALFAVAILIALSTDSLLLIGGVVSILAIILGYVVTARRIPWAALLLVFALISVMQAGKAEMRQKYWDSDQEFSLAGLPGMTIEWFEDGISTLWSQGPGIDVLERASLMWIVLRVQASTPDYVPYLNGETYALLPAMVLPRFIEPNKARSQAGLNLLTVRYGLQSEEDNDRTTIGFGLVAEGYANFGMSGVLAVGALFGALCGLITWFSTAISSVSLRMFVAIAATTVLLNVEADLSYLLVTMLQSVAGVLLAAIVPTLIGAVFHLQLGSVAPQQRARSRVS